LAGVEVGDSSRVPAAQAGQDRRVGQPFVGERLIQLGSESVSFFRASRSGMAAVAGRARAGRHRGGRLGVAAPDVLAKFGVVRHRTASLTSKTVESLSSASRLSE